MRSLRSARHQRPRTRRYRRAARRPGRDDSRRRARNHRRRSLLAALPGGVGAQEAVAAEAASIDLGPEGAADAAPQLIRTRAVVDEALRLYPPAFVFVRQALAGDLVDGLRVPAQSLVLVAPWVLHRHPRLWEKPEVFDPSQFSPGTPPPARFAYMPFGAGPRVCIGAQFAPTELVLILAIMIRAFRIRLAQPRIIRPIGIVSTQPDNPPLFLLQRRREPRAASLCP